MMIVLAVLLLALAGALAIAAVLATGTATVEVLDMEFGTSILGVFLAGLATGLITLVAVAALVIGIRQVRARRAEMKYLRQRVAEQDSEPAQPDAGEPAEPRPDSEADGDEPDRSRERGRRAVRAS